MVISGSVLILLGMMLAAMCFLGYLVSRKSPELLLMYCIIAFLLFFYLAAGLVGVQ